MRGVVAVEDLTNVGTALRVNFGYLPKNGFGVTTPGEITLDDIERVLAAADGDGNSISVICIALSTYKKLRQTQGAKELAATYRGQIFDSDTSAAHSYLIIDLTRLSPTNITVSDS